MLLYVLVPPACMKALHVDLLVGNDARKAAIDGFPAKQIVASDLRRGEKLWDLGHVLFRSSPESFPATFVAGDALNPAFLSPFTSGAEPPTEVNLSNISTLNDLRGKVSAIWAASFFHLFTEKDQHQLAHALESLLSPESGSIMFSSHMALPDKGVLTGKISDRDFRMFCHNLDSWNELWVGQSTTPSTGGDPSDTVGRFDAVVFPRDSVKLDTKLIPVKSEAGVGLWFLVWSITRLLKSAGESALAGCPQGTLYVSQTDSSANFSSVQEAINSLPRLGKAVILIGGGQYFEKLSVSRPGPLTLLGQLDPATATLRNGNASQRNIVRVWNNKYVGNGTTDEETATLTVGPAVDYPFGNVDFRAYNIDFENRAANYSIAQALVTSITLANVSFYGCTFASYQDTWYTGFDASTYVVDGIIYGQTDYLFGCGLSWFQSVILANRGCGGGITAWMGASGTINGVYIADSQIIRSPDIDATIATDGSCFLGRPWNSDARAVYLRNYMDDSINYAGFTAWSVGNTIPATTYYAESGSYGPGGNTSARVQQDHILGSEQAQIYTLEYVFSGKPKWIDSEYQYQNLLGARY
ncbi:pectin lyase fold/virulence factor [Butyriboletus roseoflavus]|nr:pectin lyase fold/virulence factor [Butyriboletus roseoflavus]